MRKIQNIIFHAEFQNYFDSKFSIILKTLYDCLYGK